MNDTTKGEFSVYQFFNNESYECVREFVDAETAVKAAIHYSHNPAAKLGITTRVIITDGGDCITWEWVHGKGIVFPKQEPQT